jgi:hypothetical protein
MESGSVSFTTALPYSSTRGSPASFDFLRYLSFARSFGFGQLSLCFVENVLSHAELLVAQPALTHVQIVCWQSLRTKLQALPWLFVPYMPRRLLDHWIVL